MPDLPGHAPDAGDAATLSPAGPVDRATVCAAPILLWDDDVVIASVSAAALAGERERVA